jgi:hypothetical protein
MLLLVPRNSAACSRSRHREHAFAAAAHDRRSGLFGGHMESPPNRDHTDDSAASTARCDGSWKCRTLDARPVGAAVDDEPSSISTSTTSSRRDTLGRRTPGRGPHSTG